MEMRSALLNLSPLAGLLQYIYHLLCTSTTIITAKYIFISYKILQQTVCLLSYAYDNNILHESFFPVYLSQYLYEQSSNKFRCIGIYAPHTHTQVQTYNIRMKSIIETNTDIQIILFYFLDLKHPQNRFRQEFGGCIDNKHKMYHSTCFIIYNWECIFSISAAHAVVRSMSKTFTYFTSFCNCQLEIKFSWF